MDEFWIRALSTSMFLVFQYIDWFVNFVNNMYEFPANIRKTVIFLPQWMRTVRTYRICGSVLSAAAFVAIWTYPLASPPKASQATAKHVATEAMAEKPQVRLPNKQADEMAREFDGLIEDISKKALTEHERKWYMEYLRATMPAKFYSICGQKECEKYIVLLRGLLSQSKDIHIICRGLHSFVARKRFIEEDTPDAGTVFEVDLKSMLTPMLNDDLVDTSNAPELLVKIGHIERATEPAPIFPSSTYVSAPAETLNETPPETNKPKTVTATAVTGPTRLEQFLKQQGWVQCRKCGQVHYMKYETFAAFNTFKCLKCGFLMNTIPFSKKINQQKQRIIEEMAN